MSRNYDNWERLVAAVIKRDEIWELCHANSRDTSFSSSVTSDFNSQFQEDFKSARSVVQELSTDPQIEEAEWVEQPEPGVYITLGYSKDDITEIRLVQLSQNIFSERAAVTWWSNNRDKVYLIFVGQPRTESGTRSTFSTNMKPTDSFEWIEKPEPGVYITLGYSKYDTTEIRSVEFSRSRFSETAAKTWWSNNRHKVYLRFVGQPRTESGPFSNESDDVELAMLETHVSLGTRSTFSTNMKPTESLVDIRANIQTVVEWVEYYEADVYVTLRAYRADRGGTRDVERVRFSGRKFDARQAEAWWLINREKVCEKYGARAGVSQIRHSSVSDQVPASSSSPIPETAAPETSSSTTTTTRGFSVLSDQNNQPAAGAEPKTDKPVTMRRRKKSIIRLDRWILTRWLSNTFSSNE